MHSAVGQQVKEPAGFEVHDNCAVRDAFAQSEVVNVNQTATLGGFALIVAQYSKQTVAACGDAACLQQSLARLTADRERNPL